MSNISEQIEKINKILLETYIDQLSLAKSDIANALRAILKFQEKDHSYEEFIAFMKSNLFGKNNGEISIADFKENSFPVQVMEEFAKINDISRRIRIIANQQYFDQNFSKTVADSPEYVFKKFKDAQIEPQEVKEFLDEVTISTATTSHPTNPNSVEYTKAAMELAEEIAQFPHSANIEALEEKMQKVIDTPIAGPKKTQKDEVAEGLLYLKSIYDSVPLVYRDLQNEAFDSGYSFLNMPKKLFNFAVWITGDGDGNPNSTEESLRHNITEFRKAIKELYAQDIDKLVISPEQKEELKMMLKHNSASEFAEKIDSYKIAGKYELNYSLDNLIAKVNNFGYHFAKIDIRHESGDIMKTVAGLLKEVGAIQDLKEDLTSDQLKTFLKDPDLIQRIANLDHTQIKDELTRRIFGRLKLIGKNPDMCDKFIIAEFKEEKNIQAVLLLLKAAGHKVGQEGAQINIVPLAEERDTLRTLPQDLAKSLSDPDYLKHVKNTKEIYFMIAKSDTVRRGGVGAQEAQETAVRESIKSIIRTLLEKGITDLENYKIIPYNGGGHALQRGGGRMTELPAVYGRYARKALKELRREFRRDPEKLAAIKKAKISVPCFTVQGHQNYILFNPAQEVGKGTLRSLISQAIYSQAKANEKVKDREVEGNENLDDEKLHEATVFAELARDYVCDNAVKSYDQVLDKNGPINQLFDNACWVLTKLNNKSSRASVRGIAEGEKLQTIGQIKGTKNTLLDQRAIGVEKICSHNGTNLVSWFGWADGLQALKDEIRQGNENYSLHEMYQSCKSMRDYMRSSAISLYTADFDVSWNMMLGQPRPDKDQINRYAQSYLAKIQYNKSAEIDPIETMAFIESEAERTAKLIYEAMTGKEAGPDFKFGDLMERWPETKKEIDNRAKQCKMGRVMEALITNLSNKNPSVEVNKNLFSAYENIYCGVDTAVNAPISMMLSLTRKRTQQAEQEKHEEIPLAKALSAKDKGIALTQVTRLTPDRRLFETYV